MLIGRVLFLMVFAWNLFASVKINPVEQIKNKGELVVAIYGKSSPPFLMKEDSGKANWTGFDIDLANYIASNLNVKLKIDDSAKTFDEVTEKVKRGLVDLGLSKLSMTAKRAQNVSFSDPYIKLKIGIVYNRLRRMELENKKGEESLFNVSSAKIGVLAGSSFVDFSKNRFPKAQINYFDSRDEIYKKIAEGKIDFTLADEATIETWRFSFPSLNLKTNIAMLPDSFDSISVAVPWDKSFLSQWLNVLFLDMKNSGQMASMKNKYFEGDSWRGVK